MTDTRTVFRLSTLYWSFDQYDRVSATRDISGVLFDRNSTGFSLEAEFVTKAAPARTPSRRSHGRMQYARALMSLIIDAPNPPTEDSMPDDRNEHPSTSPLVSPSTDWKLNATALQGALEMDPQRTAQILDEMAKAHYTSGLVVALVTGEYMTLAPELYLSFVWVAYFFVANVEACRKGHAMRAASAVARKIANAAAGTTGEFGANDLDDGKSAKNIGKRQVGMCRRAIGEPLREVRRQLKGMTLSEIKEIDPAIFYGLLLPPQIDFLGRAGVLMHNVRQATSAFIDLVESTPTQSNHRPAAQLLLRALSPPRAQSPLNTQSPLSSLSCAARPAVKARDAPAPDPSVGDTGVTTSVPAPAVDEGMRSVAPMLERLERNLMGRIDEMAHSQREHMGMTHEISNSQREHMGMSHDTLVLTGRIHTSLHAFTNAFTHDQAVLNERARLQQAQFELERRERREVAEEERREREATMAQLSDRLNALGEQAANGNQHVLGAVLQSQRAHTVLPGDGALGGGGAAARGSTKGGASTGHGTRAAGGAAALSSRVREPTAAVAPPAPVTGAVGRRGTVVAAAKAKAEKNALDGKKVTATKAKASSRAKAKAVPPLEAEALEARAKPQEPRATSSLIPRPFGRRKRVPFVVNAEAPPVAMPERSGAAMDLTAALAQALSARASVTSSCMSSDGFAAPTPFPVTRRPGDSLPASSTAPPASPETGGSFELDSDIYLAFGPMGSPLLMETVKKDAQYDAQSLW